MKSTFNLDGTLQTGIVLVLFPSQSMAGGVVERSGSSGWQEVFTLDDLMDGGSPFFDYQPMDGQVRYYRAKHREPGFTDGPYTDIVEAVPQVIPALNWKSQPWLLANVIPLQLVMIPVSETSSSIHVTASINRDPANLGLSPTVAVYDYFNVPVPSPTGSNGWVIQKPSTGFGRVVFQNSLAGRISDQDAIDITAADVSSSASWLVLNLNVSASSADFVGVSASVVNPFSVPTVVQVAASGNIASLTNDATGRWTIGRPASGEGYVTFRVTSSAGGVIEDYDTFYVSTEPNPYLNVGASVTNVGTDGIGLTASIAVRDSNSTTGALTGVTITSASQGLSGLGSRLYTTANTGGVMTNVYHITRPLYGQGTGRLTWEATKTGYTRDTDSLEVPERVTGLARLTCTARITSMTSTAVSMSVAVSDSVPLTGSYIQLSVASTGVGTILPSASFIVANGATQSYVAHRPVNTGAGEVRFTATASNRVSDTDIVVVSATDGSTSGYATITLGSPVSSSNGITFPYSFSSTSTATRVNVAFQEHTLQPSASSVEFAGQRVVGSPLYPDDGRTSIFVPVAKGGNWLAVSFLPLDRNGNRGIITSSIAQSVTGGSVPSLFTNAVNVGNTSTTVTNRLTMPGASLPDKIRVYRDGVQFGSDITRSAGAGGTQDVVHSGLAPSTTYGWEYEGINNNGTATATKTTVLYAGTSGGGSLSAPTLTFNGWQNVDGGTIYFTVTPAGGTPSGVTWVGEYDLAGSGFIYSIPDQTSTYFGITGVGTTYADGLMRVRASKSGYTTSANSNEAFFFLGEAEQ